MVIYTEEILKQITQGGTLGYPLSKLINILDIEDEEQFSNDFFDEDCVVFKHYRRGIDKSDFLLDSKLFDMAKNGDLKALEKYESRKKRHQYDYEDEMNTKKINEDPDEI